jgi:hypothetical protein
VLAGGRAEVDRQLSRSARGGVERGVLELGWPIPVWPAELGRRVAAVAAAVLKAASVAKKSAGGSTAPWIAPAPAHEFWADAALTSALYAHLGWAAAELTGAVDGTAPAAGGTPMAVAATLRGGRPLVLTGGQRHLLASPAAPAGGGVQLCGMLALIAMGVEVIFMLPCIFY